MHAHQVGPSIAFLGTAFSHVLGHPVGSTQGGVFGCGTTSSVVFVVCVPSLSVVQPFVCWSDPMALVAPTLWGSGASRRRQSLPDDLHASQSCPDDSEHGSGSVSRSRSTSFSTRWSVFSFREALFARSMRGSISARASSVRLRRRRRCCSTTPPARRGAQLRPATLLFALIVVCRSADGITLPLRVDGLRLGLGGRVTPDVFRLHACRPLAQESAVQWCLCQKQCAGQQMASSDAGRFVRSMSSSAHKQDEVGAA